MVQIQLTLSEDASQFIHEQVSSGRYQSPSAFVADLVEQARIGIPSDRLAQLVREGLESGEGVEITDEWFERRREEVQAELERRRTP
ncbi:MAG: hypothetical protein SFU86_22705 [Pirellulaceae bacterium]|nr:hypothetical protein [Pirellulaceae bacterium]